MGEILGLDLGSVRVGRVLVEDTLPLRVLRSHTLRVDAADLGAAVTEILSWLTPSCARVAIEHGRPYVPADATPQAIQAMWAAHTVCTRIHERLLMALADRGLEVISYGRASWAHVLVPHRRGGISEAESNAAICARCDVGSWEALGSQDERDAAGVAAGAWLIDSEPRKSRHKYRDRRKDKSKPRREAREAMSEEEKRKKNAARLCEYRKRVRAKTAARLLAAGCSCGSQRHINACHLSGFSSRVAAAVARGSWVR